MEPTRASLIRPVSRGSVGLARLQGLFFLAFGVWPLLHLRSFLAVTGRKTDLWLVQTCGALIAVAGLSLLAAARHRRVFGEWKFFAALFSFALGASDVVFHLHGDIPRIYLADAAIEFCFVLGWIALARR
jgi:hypothetical protein